MELTPDAQFPAAAAVTPDAPFPEGSPDAPSPAAKRSKQTPDAPTPEVPVSKTPDAQLPAAIKPDPILFLGGEGGDLICKRIAETVADDIGVKPYHKFVKVFPRTQVEAEKILAILTDAKAGHFRHSRRKRNFFKTVVKGLTLDTDPQSIASALAAEGFVVEKVAQLTRARTKAPLPIYQVLIIRTGRFKDVYNQSSLLGRKVIFEPYKKIARIPQCYCCQNYGHVSTQCHMGPRCRFCGLGHDSRACPTRQDLNAHRCANCGGPHLSSSVTCPERPQPPKRELPESAARRQHQPKPLPQQADDAASLLEALTSVRDVIADVFGDISTFIRKAKALSAATTKADKMLALFTLIQP